ncbi:MAG: hypothetical protein MJA29_04350 [Candidatus Omnitrophica bacterium]|nr:hypothetical protein [Candidatus Omnitrophota bacterium]
MIQESKLKFFYNNMLGAAGSTISVDTTNSTGDYSIDYVHNFLEVNSWKERSTGISTTRTFNYDAGVGNEYGADYLAIYGHNLNGSTIVLDASSDNFVSSTSTAASFTVGSTGPILVEFTNPGAKRYWRMRLSRSTATESNIQIMAWGTKTELDYIQPPFDPYSQEIKANVNVTQGGYVSGIHTRYTERQLPISMLNESTDVYESVKTWFETHGPQNFIMAWDSTGSSADVWLVRPDMSMNNPINVDHLRDITINLNGRKL